MYLHLISVRNFWNREDEVLNRKEYFTEPMLVTYQSVNLAIFHHLDFY